MIANTPATPTATAPMTMPNTPAKTGRGAMVHDGFSCVVKKLAFPYETPATPTTSTLATMPRTPIKFGRRAMDFDNTSTVVRRMHF